MEAALYDPWHARELRRVHVPALCRLEPVCHARGLHSHHDVLHSVSLRSRIPDVQSIRTTDRCDRGRILFLRWVDFDHDRPDIRSNRNGTQWQSRDEDPATGIERPTEGTRRIRLRYSSHRFHHWTHARPRLGALCGACTWLCLHARAGGAGAQGCGCVGLLWPGNRITPPTHRIWRTSCCALCTSSE